MSKKRFDGTEPVTPADYGHTKRNGEGIFENKPVKLRFAVAEGAHQRNR